MQNKIKYGVILFLLVVFVVKNSKAQAPDPPVITTVSIEPSLEYPGAVRLYWLPSPTDGVTGYILYRYIKDENNDGYQIVSEDIGAEVFTYLDIAAQAHLKSERYKISAYIEKDNLGLPSIVHQTLFLQNVIYDSCKMTNTLKWNPYIGWDADYYVLDGDGGIIVDGIQDTNYTHNIESGITYDYRIMAVQKANSSFRSFSNQVFKYTTPLITPDESNFYVQNISYDGTGVNLTSVIDVDADIIGHSLKVSSTQEGKFIELVFKPLEQNNELSFVDDSPNQPLFYKVNAVGVCGDTVAETEVVKPIVLEAESNETEVSLSWNKSFVESTEIYKLFVAIDGNDFISLDDPLGTAIDLTFEEMDPQNQSEVFCFFIEATELNNNKSFSNTVCVSRKAKIEIPTAFSPNNDGLNDYFGPFVNTSDVEESYIKNAIVAEFKLVIYDKFGGVVFEKNEPHAVWRGDVNGRYVTEGGYVYYIWFKTAQGKSYEQSGSINVVFP